MAEGDTAPAAGHVPANANAHCPGTAHEQAGRADACQGCPNQAACASAPKGPDPDLEAIANRMKSIKHKILVLSGKGGVGKSTVSAQVAFALSRHFGREVGLLDIDICGPSVPKMLGLEGEEVHQSAAGWSPVYVEESLGVMSVGFMLPNPDDAVIWRGPRKNGLIKQFLKDVDWGEVDYLVVDAPPGTSDEHISIAQYLRATEADGAVIVTTPQEVSIIDVRKEINFCRKVGMPILGVVENMSALRVPIGKLRFVRSAQGEDVTREALEALEELGGLCAEVEVFSGKGGGAAAMAKDLGVPLLGRIPLDPALSRASDAGECVLDAAGGMGSAAALKGVVERIIEAVECRTGRV
eukprot:evm.model.scf_1415.1 EVM.evm.TU.scf_1415.1   scf_1415:8909-9970(-)